MRATILEEDGGISEAEEGETEEEVEEKEAEERDEEEDEEEVVSQPWSSVGEAYVPLGVSAVESNERGAVAVEVADEPGSSPTPWVCLPARRLSWPDACSGGGSCDATLGWSWSGLSMIPWAFS